MEVRDLFVSYSSHDQSFLVDVQSCMKKYQLTYWLDQHDVRPGDDVQDKIQSQLKDSNALLVIFTEESAASKWVNREISIAQLNNKRILPFNPSQ